MQMLGDDFRVGGGWRGIGWRGEVPSKVYCTRNARQTRETGCQDRGNQSEPGKQEAAKTTRQMHLEIHRDTSTQAT